MSSLATAILWQTTAQPPKNHCLNPRPHAAAHEYSLKMNLTGTSSPKNDPEQIY
jgi:hypothetical protein